MPAETEAKRFACDEPTRRTVEVEQFCSWSACKIINKSRALVTAGFATYSSIGTPNVMRKKFSSKMQYEKVALPYLGGMEGVAIPPEMQQQMQGGGSNLKSKYGLE